MSIFRSFFSIKYDKIIKLKEKTIHELKWQFESLTLKLNSFLVHWWKLSIVIRNGSWEWCSICCDTKLFIFVNITWINIIEIFYERRLHGLCRRLVAHNNPSFTWWKFEKKQNTCVILGNCMYFFFGICLIFLSHFRNRYSHSFHENFCCDHDDWQNDKAGHWAGLCLILYPECWNNMNSDDELHDRCIDIDPIHGQIHDEIFLIIWKNEWKKEEK